MVKDYNKKNDIGLYDLSMMCDAKKTDHLLKYHWRPSNDYIFPNSVDEAKQRPASI